MKLIRYRIRTTFRIMTLSITAVSIILVDIITISIATLSTVTSSITQHKTISMTHLTMPLCITAISIMTQHKNKNVLVIVLSVLAPFCRLN